MKYLLLIFTITTALFFSCQKKYIENDWNVDLDISVNAIITDSHEIQLVLVQRNSPIDDPQVAQGIDDAVIQIKYNNMTYQFNEETPGRYLSTQPFGIENNDDFTVHYKIGSDVLRDTFSGPNQSIISKITHVQGNTDATLLAEIEATEEQFYLFNIYDLRIDTNQFGMIDSSWAKKLGSPAFNLAYAKKGATQVEILHSGLTNEGASQGELIRVDITPISERAYQYFQQLNDYSENLSTYNLFVNAPFYYSNHFYGVTYVTNWSSYLVAT